MERAKAAPAYCLGCFQSTIELWVTPRATHREAAGQAALEERAQAPDEAAESGEQMARAVDSAQVAKGRCSSSHFLPIVKQMIDSDYAGQCTIAHQVWI